MRKILVLLLLLAALFCQAQHNPDGHTYAYSTMQEAIDAAMKIGQKITVKEKGVGGNFYVASIIGLTADTGTIFDKYDGTALVRDMSQSKAINVQWFGMIGDSSTDNYNAYRRVVDYTNRIKRGVHLFAPPGVYLFDTFKIVNGSNKNTITDGNFINCYDLTIEGKGAKFVSSGKIHMTADAGNHITSYELSFRPFVFTNCDFVTLSGFELDGQCGIIQEDSVVTEGQNDGISVVGSRNVTIKNVYTHHWADDGVTVKANTSVTPNIVCENVIGENIISKYNARQGMTISGLNTGVFTDCEFSYIGDSLGIYAPGHAPRYGIDFEPDFDISLGKVNKVTGGVHFFNCKFIGNQGAAFGSIIGTDGIYFHGGIVDNTLHNYPYAIIMGVPNFLVEGMNINTGTGAIYPTWADGRTDQSSVLQNNIIKSSGSGIVLTWSPQNIPILEGNRFIGTHTSPFNSYFPYITSESVVKDNKFFIPKAIYGGTNSGLITSATVVQGNSFSTDLDTSGGKFISIHYESSGVWQNEMFPINKAIQPVGVAFYTQPYQSSLGALYSRDEFIRDGPTGPQTGKIDLVWGSATGGSHIANFAGMTATATPQRSALDLTVRFANFWYTGLSISGGGAASGMNFSTHATNTGTIAVGGYQNASSTYTAQETAMNALQLQNGGMSLYTGSNLTPGATVSLNKTLQLDSNGTATVIVPASSGASWVFGTSRTLGANKAELRFGGGSGTDISAYQNNVLASVNFNALSTFFNSNFIIAAQKPLMMYDYGNNYQNFFQIQPAANNKVNFVTNRTLTAMQLDTIGRIIAGGPVTPKSYTVATLPAIPFTNDICFVTDALNPVAGSAVQGGGTSFVPVYRAASQWIVMSASAAAGTTLNGTGYVKQSGTTTSYVPSIPNSDLANNSININGTSVPLGGSVTVTGGAEYIDYQTGNYTVSTANGNVQNIVFQLSAPATLTLPTPTTNLVIYVSNMSGNNLTTSVPIYTTDVTSNTLIVNQRAKLVFNVSKAKYYWVN